MLAELCAFDELASVKKITTIVTVFAWVIEGIVMLKYNQSIYSPCISLNGGGVADLP